MMQPDTGRSSESSGRASAGVRPNAAPSSSEEVLTLDWRSQNRHQVRELKLNQMTVYLDRLAVSRRPAEQPVQVTGTLIRNVA